LKRTFWAFSSVVLIAIVLRPPVAAIGPLLSEIQNHWLLSEVQVSLLASLPVLCFGLGAFLAPWLVNRFGMKNTVTMILSTIVAGIALRAWFGFELMLSLSILAALAIALANVVFPTIIRAEFPNRVASMTALYTTLLAVFASVAAFIAVPSSSALGGFGFALLLWLLPAVLALFAWLVLARIDGSHLNQEHAEQAHPSSKVFKSSVTWSILGFFGLQSMNFYAILNWLPGILEASGYSAANAGIMLGVTTVVGVPAGLLLTNNLKRFKSLATLAFVISIVTALGMLLILTTGVLQVIGCVIAGMGLASSFPLSLALIAMKANNQQQTTLLSAIAQGGGYLVAAVGTFALGMIHEATSSWQVPILILVVAALIQAFVGLIAGSKQRL
jgi:CP family cyanate transporter-like MFS transporter